MHTAGKLIRILRSISRMLLGLVFLASGALKLISPQQASDLLSQLSSLDQTLSRTLIIIGSLIEFVLGAALIIGNGALRMASLASTIALLVFTFVGLWALQNPMPCGCFGDIVEFQTDEYFIARNIVLLLLSLFVLNGTTNSVRNQTD
jgi:uncharacterized membrane protein YphA (DoxX/SURF4 family)